MFLDRFATKPIQEKYLNQAIKKIYLGQIKTVPFKRYRFFSGSAQTRTADPVAEQSSLQDKPLRIAL